MDDSQGSAHAETMERMLRVMIDDYATAPASARVVARADALERARGLLGLGVAQWCVLLGMPPAGYANVLAGRADLCADARRRAWLCGVAADGRVSFQQAPCAAAGRSERLQLRDLGSAPRLDEPAASGSKPPARPLSREEVWLKGAERERRLREIDQEIAREREAMSSRAQMMEREMAHLRSKKASANNNLAGATWEQSISVEMQAVAQKYRALNDISTERIRALGDERKEAQKTQ